jgi:tripartite-type tricarboxylate transporter receptor subunit TctC
MLLLALAALGLLLAVEHVNAQAWPARPVRFIAPFAAGGTSDLLGRIAAEHLRDKLHQQFYVENRVGAGGMIGSREVALAEPDGTTFVISGIASHVIAPAFSRAPPYDGLRDFTHVAYLGGPPVVLVVHPSLGSSFKDFLDLARRTPEGLNYVSSGVGTHGFLFAEDMARREHFKLTHVPYKGSNPAMLDLMCLLMDAALPRCTTPLTRTPGSIHVWNPETGALLWKRDNGDTSQSWMDVSYSRDGGRCSCCRISRCRAGRPKLESNSARIVLLQAMILAFMRSRHRRMDALFL